MRQKVLRLPDVMERVGLSRSTIYLRIGDGSFPKPIALGERAVGWLDSEIDKWLEHRINLSKVDKVDDFQGDFTS